MSIGEGSEVSSSSAPVSSRRICITFHGTSEPRCLTFEALKAQSPINKLDVVKQLRLYTNTDVLCLTVKWREDGDAGLPYAQVSPEISSLQVPVRDPGGFQRMLDLSGISKI